MRTLRILMLVAAAGLLSRAASAHVALIQPNGGEVFGEGEVVTIRWGIVIAHPLQDWDLWYATDNATVFNTCADQAGYNWVPIELDMSPTCTNGGGSCANPSGCMVEYFWTVPEGIASETVKIRVRMDNSGTDYYDVSDEPFTIQAPSSTPDLLERRGFLLEPNHPNPFAGSTSIRYALDQAAHPVRLSIFDPAGRLVRRLVEGFKPAGRHSVIWDGTGDAGGSIPGGLYFYTLEVDGERVTRKMILAR